MVISEPLLKGQEFWLPDWIPGSYMIRDFARNILRLEAFEQERAINVYKKTKSRWILGENVNSVEIRYQIYAWDLSVRSAHFDDQHCFFNGTSVFLALNDQENIPHKVQIVKPEHNENNSWKVATSMDACLVDVSGFGEYESANYAELIDHPFEIADFIETSFMICGVAHRMIFAEAPKRVDLDRIARDVQKICQFECDFFSDTVNVETKPPFEKYLFMIFVQKRGFGGLEHMSSTALHCSHSDLPRIGDDTTHNSEDYQRFLSLCCHEYFHCWNVKRIKPAKFESYQLQQEVHTELLWFFEGITSYYDELFLVRAGVITSENYLDMFAKNITRYMRGKGRQKQTIADSSFDAWTKFYKQDENAPNSIVSYYVKGGLVAFCLDFEIRKLTNNAKSLDDLMRLMWQQFGLKGLGVEEKDIQKMTEQLVLEPMSDFFDFILYSTKELDLQRLFEQLGIEYQLVPETKQSDKGGYLAKAIKQSSVCSLNITHKMHSSGAQVNSVFDGGSASNIGLSNNDIIIALDDYRVESKELDKRISSYPLGSKIKISFFRREKLYHRNCELNVSEANICYLSFKQGAPDQAFNHWVHTKN